MYLTLSRLAEIFILKCDGYIGNKVKNEVPIDMLYSIGLFHDCGIPLLALKYPDYKNILMEANRSGYNSVALEEKHYLTNHAVLGCFVLVFQENLKLNNVNFRLN